MRRMIVLSLLGLMLIGSSGCSDTTPTDGVTPPAGGTPPASDGVQEKDQGPQGEG